MAKALPVRPLAAKQSSAAACGRVAPIRPTDHAPQAPDRRRLCLEIGLGCFLDVLRRGCAT
jgi:hypothetical protein